MRDITYSSKPITLGNMIDIQRFQSEGDSEALLELILDRTDLTEEEAVQLDMDDIDVIVSSLVLALEQAIALRNLGKSLNE